MKISNLIAEIVQTATDIFGRNTDHANDTINVSIDYRFLYSDGSPVDVNDSPDWFVQLIRHSQNELDRGEVFCDDEGGVNLVEDELGFHATGPRLLTALLDLLDQVRNANSWYD